MYCLSYPHYVLTLGFFIANAWGSPLPQLAEFSHLLTHALALPSAEVETVHKY